MDAAQKLGFDHVKAQSIVNQLSFATRNIVDFYTIELSILNQGFVDSMEIEIEGLSRSTSITGRMISKVLATGMNPKKQHEVSSMAALITDLSKRLNTNKIIDIGSGSGYLDNVLMFQYGLSVVGLERNPNLIQRAFQRSSAISRSCSKEYDLQLLNLNVTNDTEIDAQSAIICSLHGCGDLAVDCMDHFLKGEAVGLVFVACCYNMKKRFPSSRSISVKLSPEELMLACQPPLYIQDDLIIQKHHFRCILQVIISELQLSYTPKRLKLGSSLKGGFVNYAIAAFEAFGIPFPSNILTLEVLQEYELKYAARIHDLKLLLKLRGLLANLIESLIIADYYFYLVESNLCSSVKIIPIFDPKISARNMAICARK